MSCTVLIYHINHVMSDISSTVILSFYFIFSGLLWASTLRFSLYFIWFEKGGCFSFALCVHKLYEVHSYVLLKFYSLSLIMFLAWGRYSLFTGEDLQPWALVPRLHQSHSVLILKCPQAPSESLSTGSQV